MRLTLRTLLAYLDRILDPQDAHELELKIKDSEIANQLVHRIRKVLSQRQTEVVPVDAQGLGRDANGVAEYLDNTLSSDKIPDFERICLESDTHLAEVAACHQILTRVLGEPAEIPTDLRQKIYGLRLDGGQVQNPQRTERKEPVAADRSIPLAADAGTAPAPRRLADNGSAARRVDMPVLAGMTVPPRDEDERWSEAPDYLKRPRRGRWKTAGLSTLIAFCLALAAIFGMGPLNHDHPLAKWVGGRGSRPELESDTVASASVASASAAGSPTPTPGSRTEPGAAASAEGVNPPSAEPVRNSPPVRTQPDESNPWPEPAEAEPADDERAIAADGPDESVASVESPAADREAAWDLPSADAATPPAGSGNDLTMPPPAAGGELADTDSRLPLTKDNSLDLPDPTAELTDLSPPPPVPDPDDELATDDGSAGEPPVSEEPAADEGAGDSAPIAVDPLEPPAIINPLATLERPPVDSNEPVPALPATGQVDDPVMESEPAPPAPPQAVDVGRFLDRQQVLIKLDASANEWQRVPTGSRLQFGDILMSLPTYRVPLVLASGMQVSLIGPTRVAVLEADQANTPSFQLDFGRLLIATFAQTGTTFGLQWAPDHHGVLTLADMNTTLAIELQHRYLPGTDPASAERHQLLHVYVTSGAAEWKTPESLGIQLAAGQRLTVLDHFPPRLSDQAELPAWVESRDARPRDPLAAQELSQRLVETRPVALILREEAERPQLEIRSLAVCSLAYLDDPSPLLVALNDPEMRAYWTPQFDTLMDVASLSTTQADQLRAAIIQRHGDDSGLDFFRLLWGYSPLQLQEDGGQQLIEFLDHPSSDFRFVANELLKQITGQPSAYRANATERDPRRRSATMRWRKLLESGQLVYGQVPELVQLLQDAQTDAP